MIKTIIICAVGIYNMNHAIASDIQFEPRAKASNINHIYAGGWEHFVGGGMATFDCNADNFPDAFLAGGENPARLLVNTTKEPGGQISMRIKASAVTELTGVTGAYPIDINSDSIQDLFVMRVGENKILKGLGNCEFEDATQMWGFKSGDRWTTSFSAFWQDDQSWPTLAIGNYVDRKDPDGPFGTCDSNFLYNPKKNQHFAEPSILEPGYCALSMLISDWQRKGSPDLRISNDRHYYLNDGHEQMFSLSQNRFLDSQDGWRNIKLWGMGIASQDLNTDGKPDVMLTSMGDQLLQFYDSNGRFIDAPFSLGTYSHRPYFGDDGRPSTGWHAEFGDMNNDGLSDLFIAKGNVDQMPGLAMKDPNNLLLQKQDGTFYEVGQEAGIANVHRSRGATLTDFNLDGRLDIAVMNRRAPFEIYENKSRNTGNYLSLKLKTTSNNRDAIGAWVELRTEENGAISAQEITIGGGHASGEIGPIHFGLGNNEKAEIRVIWPNKKTSNWQQIQANQFMTIAPKLDGGLLVSKAHN